MAKLLYNQVEGKALYLGFRGQIQYKMDMIRIRK